LVNGTVNIYREKLTQLNRTGKKTVSKPSLQMVHTQTQRAQSKNGYLVGTGLNLIREQRKNFPETHK
jgi:hypothetical protein